MIKSLVTVAILATASALFPTKCQSIDDLTTAGKTYWRANLELYAPVINETHIQGLCLRYSNSYGVSDIRHHWFYNGIDTRVATGAVGDTCDPLVYACVNTNQIGSAVHVVVLLVDSILNGGVHPSFEKPNLLPSYTETIIDHEMVQNKYFGQHNLISGDGRVILSSFADVFSTLTMRVYSNIASTWTYVRSLNPMADGSLFGIGGASIKCMTASEDLDIMAFGIFIASGSYYLVIYEREPGDDSTTWSTYNAFQVEPYGSCILGANPDKNVVVMAIPGTYFRKQYIIRKSGGSWDKTEVVTSLVSGPTTYFAITMSGSIPFASDGETYLISLSTNDGFFDGIIYNSSNVGSEEVSTIDYLMCEPDKNCPAKDIVIDYDGSNELVIQGIVHDGISEKYIIQENGGTTEYFGDSGNKNWMSTAKLSSDKSQVLICGTMFCMVKGFSGSDFVHVDNILPSDASSYFNDELFATTASSDLSVIVIGVGTGEYGLDTGGNTIFGRVYVYTK